MNIIVVRLFFLSLLSLVAFSCTPQQNSLIDQWQSGNGLFKIQITERNRSTTSGLSEFCYLFESLSGNSGDRQEIMTLCTDDDIPIPRKQVRFLSDQMAYAFMTTKYAVSTDAGRTWSVWDANKEMPNIKYPGELFIKDANVASDGSGVIVLASRSNIAELTELLTQDYGMHWTKK